MHFGVVASYVPSQVLEVVALINLIESALLWIYAVLKMPDILHVQF